MPSRPQGMQAASSDTEVQRDHMHSGSTDKDGRKREVRGLWEKKNGFLSFLVEGISSQCVTFPAPSAGAQPARAAVLPGDTEDFTVKKIRILGYVSVRYSLEAEKFMRAGRLDESRKRRIWKV